jgi:aminoglycoside phosphotransferase (APT) family kinase protein
MAPLPTAPSDDATVRAATPAAGVPRAHGDEVPDVLPGQLIAAGESADVFALDEHHVLRRYREARDVTAEVALLRHVTAQGFPAPYVEHLGGGDLRMERLHGPTLLQALAAGEVGLREGAGILADLHRRLHALPVPAGWQGTSSGWPHATGGPVIVHLDLHPGNVVLTEAHGPTVIDWANARTGTPGLDVGLTALILAEVAVDAGGDYSHAARAMLVAFLHDAGVDPMPELDSAVAVRASDPALVAGERELLGDAQALVRSLAPQR